MRYTIVPKWHRECLALLLSCSMILVVGCASPKGTSIRPGYPQLNLSQWTNLYKGDARLAAIGFLQAPPDGPGETIDEYRGAHPAQVIYYFWGGATKGFNYFKDGSLKDTWNEVWSDQIGQEHYWRFADFSYGSDPHFLHHKDPRLPN